MKKRSRAHEAGSIEAGSSISKSIFFANRVDRAVVGSQIEPARAPRSAQSSQNEPARAARSSQSRPDRARKCAPGSQSSHTTPDGASEDAPGRPAGRPVRPRIPQLDKPRRAISLWIDSLETCRHHGVGLTPPRAAVFLAAAGFKEKS